MNVQTVASLSTVNGDDRFYVSSISNDGPADVATQQLAGNLDQIRGTPHFYGPAHPGADNQ